MVILMRMRWCHFLLACTALVAGDALAADRASPESFGIAPVVDQIKREIRIAQEEGAEVGLLFRVDSVTLVINLVSVDSGGAGIDYNFAVAGADFGIGAGTSTEQMLRRQVTLDMTPDEELLISGGESLGIAEAVLEVKNAVRTALKTEPEFKLNKFLFSFDFQIGVDTEGQMSFIVFEANKATKRQNAHNLTVSMSVVEF